MAAKLAQLASRLTELDALLSSETATRDMDGYRKLTREHSELTPVVELYKRNLAREADLAEAQQMLADPEMKSFAEEEIGKARDDLLALEKDIERALLPKDPNDDKNIFLEIRAGTGGDESALFAGALFRMYTRYAERNRWQVELVSESPSELGGYKEVILRLIGQGAYSRLKFESGGHRVQRVPETESQGRIHTSTATVAVMPEVEDVEISIEDKDLKIDVYRSTGPGGQSVNTTDSAVRITHMPTGIVVAMQDEKSQLQNKNKAMRVLRARLYEAERERQQAELAATRKAQVGTGDRAEKIRTYNFAENRVTDHRIKLTVHRLDQILEGDLEEYSDALTAEDRRRALESL